MNPTYYQVFDELLNTSVPVYSGHIGYTIEVFGGGLRKPWKAGRFGEKNGVVRLLHNP